MKIQLNNKRVNNLRAAICNSTNKVRNHTRVIPADLVLLVYDLGMLIGKLTIFLYFVCKLIFKTLKSTIIVHNFTIPILSLES
jgi:hypothetical protein